MEWLYQTPRSFHHIIAETIARNGYLGEVFLPLVSYNTALFLAQNLWKEKYSFLQERNALPFFAASEKGWDGRTKNLKTVAIPEGDGVSIKGEKSHVMPAEFLLVLAREKNKPFLALTGKGSISWDNRKDHPFFSPESPQLYPYLGNPEQKTDLSHYEVRLDFQAERQKFILPEPEKYRFFSAQIRDRERISFSVAAYGMLRYLDAGEARKYAGVAEKLMGVENFPLAQGVQEDSDSVFSALYALAERMAIVLHPLWYFPQKKTHRPEM